MPKSLFLGVAALLLLSGCAATTGAPTAGGGPGQTGSEIAQPGGLREDAATLSGIVIDESQLPLPGAIVGLLENQLQGTTDAAGAFKFTNLAPGTYTLSVAALGFAATSQRLSLAANADEKLVVHVVRIAVEVPYHETLPYDGFFSCKMGIPVQSTACGSILVGVAFRTDDVLWANDKAFQWWNLTSPNWRTIVGELQWTQATFATTTKLRSSFDHDRFGSHWFCGQEGHNPLYYRFERPDNDTAARCVGNTASATVEPKEPVFGKALVTGFRVPFGCVPASTSAACQGDPLDNPPMYLAFQQKVRSYMSIFYAEPAPDLWHAQSDV